jgi:hypothetical protein
MNYLDRLGSNIVEFLPEEKLSEFKDFVKERDPELFEKLHREKRELSRYRKPIVQHLKWCVKNNNTDSLQILLDNEECTHNDVCVMAAHKGKNDIVDMCMNYGMQPTNELFIAACTGGHMELAKHFEKELSNNSENYNPEMTYDNIDYNTAVYGVIAKSRFDMLKWLMTKSISPDYRIIGKILPVVKSKEVIALTISATPSANKDDVLVELNKLKVHPSIHNLQASIIYECDDITQNIMSLEEMKREIKEASQKQKDEILSLLVLRNDIRTIEQFLTHMNAEEIKLSVDRVLIDVQSSELLSYFARVSSNQNNSKMIRAAVKIGDFEMAESLGYKLDIESTLEGAVLGNHSWLVKDICSERHHRNQVRRSIAEKLLRYSRELGYKSTERILLVELNK